MEMFELRIVSIQIHENLFQAGTDNVTLRGSRELWGLPLRLRDGCFSKPHSGRLTCTSQPS